MIQVNKDVSNGLKHQTGFVVCSFLVVYLIAVNVAVSLGWLWKNGCWVAGPQVGFFTGFVRYVFPRDVYPNYLNDPSLAIIMWSYLEY